MSIEKRYRMRKKHFIKIIKDVILEKFSFNEQKIVKDI